MNTTSLTACAKPRSDALLDHGKSEAIGAAGLADVSVIDLNDMICPQDSCAAVVGNVLLYRDESHPDGHLLEVTGVIPLGETGRYWEGADPGNFLAHPGCSAGLGNSVGLGRSLLDKNHCGPENEPEARAPNGPEVRAATVPQPSGLQVGAENGAAHGRTP